MLPVFLELASKHVVVIGGGEVALQKTQQLLAAGAQVTVVAPQIVPTLAALKVTAHTRGFVDTDLDAAWFTVAAATPEVNREVAAAAETRRLWINVVDDAEHANAYFAGVVRRGDVTIAISSGGRAPALTALLRRAFEKILPVELAQWAEKAAELRGEWREKKIPLADRRDLLLSALNAGARS